MIRNQQIAINAVLLTSVFTMATICLSVVFVLLAGLFNEIVDNKEIFSIIGPAFNTIIGAFVGLLGGISLGRKPTNKEDPSAVTGEEDQV